MSAPSDLESFSRPPRRERPPGVGDVALADLALVLEQAGGLQRTSAALTNAHRAAILCLAIRRPGLRLSDYAALLEASLALMSYHATQLELMGLLRCQVDGRSRRVYPGGPHVESAVASLLEAGRALEIKPAVGE